MLVNRQSPDGSCRSSGNKVPLGFHYALPVLAVAFLESAIAVLQGVYAKDFGLALSSIALVLLISRIFDAVTDPLIGYWCDWHCSRGGDRRSFITVGAILFIISGYFLYIPPDDVSVIYFAVWYLAFYFSATLFGIPHLAWANDLSQSVEEKSRMYGWRAFMSSVGLMAFFILPLLPFFDSNEITPEVLRWSVFVAFILLVSLLFICLKRLPSGVSSFPRSKNLDFSDAVNNNFHNLWLSVCDNYPLQLFFASFVSCGFGVGMSMTLLFLFIDSYLGLGENFAILYVVTHVFSISSVALWTKLSIRLGKQIIWALAMMMLTFGLFGLGFLTPGAQLISLGVFLTCLYCGFAAWMVIAPALLADIADYSTWKYGQDRSATYFSLYTFVSKTNIALGGAAGMAIAGWYGFDASATEHSAESAFGLYLSIAWLPLPFLILSAVFMGLMPITMNRHKIIRRRLDSRLNRQCAAS